MSRAGAARRGAAQEEEEVAKEMREGGREGERERAALPQRSPASVAMPAGRGCSRQPTEGCSGAQAGRQAGNQAFRQALRQAFGQAFRQAFRPAGRQPGVVQVPAGRHCLGDYGNVGGMVPSVATPTPSYLVLRGHRL